MLLKNFCLALCLGLFTNLVNAAQDDDLQLFFNKMQSLKADFSQQVFGPRRELQQTSAGEVIVQRPGKFRWDYRKPFQQHIVADGTRVWLYDVDLEQVSIKPQDQTMANTPASLLSDGSQLNLQFDVMAVIRDDGREWFELIPKHSDSGFEALFLVLDKKGLISEMELQDSFGQTTLLKFKNVVMNKKIRDDTFKLIIPSGVDVIDETAGR